MSPRGQRRVAVALGVCVLVWRESNRGAQVKTPDPEYRAHLAWLSDRLDEATSIRRGMSKSDLLKVFMEDGGLQGQEERWVLRSCTLIKVDVTFEGPDIRGITLASQLRVKSVPRPYLERMFAD